MDVAWERLFFLKYLQQFLTIKNNRIEEGTISHHTQNQQQVYLERGLLEEKSTEGSSKSNGLTNDEFKESPQIHERDSIVIRMTHHEQP